MSPPSDAEIHWVDLTHLDGTRIYARSLSFVLIRAVRELFPGARVTIEHSLAKGLYGEIHHGDGRALTADDVALRQRADGGDHRPGRTDRENGNPPGPSDRAFRPRRPGRQGQAAQVQDHADGQGLPVRRHSGLFLRLYRTEHGLFESLRPALLRTGLHSPVSDGRSTVDPAGLRGSAETGPDIQRVRALGGNPRYRRCGGA